MVFGILKKLFGGAPSEAQSLEGFVDYVVRSLVDEPGDVNVTTVESGGKTVIQVTCCKSDIGKVIGKSGRTIAAIRSLVNGAACNTGSRRVMVEILD